jgi:signal transduction histidine kinase
MDLKLAELGFEDLLASVNDATNFRSKERGVPLVIECEDRAIRFTGDKSMVERSLINVVANAIDASAPDKSVRLMAQQLPRHADGNDWVRFTVRDEGCGIPSDHLSRIFQPYFTTKDTGNSIRGSGLGLTIVQRFVNLHGGNVSIASAVGKGTTVQIDLPGRPTIKSTEDSS